MLTSNADARLLELDRDKGAADHTASRKPDPTVEAQVLLVDSSMEGVRFSRVREMPPFAFEGIQGGFTLCYMVRGRSVWLDVAPPVQDAFSLELAPGAIVSLSGRIPHRFRSSATLDPKSVRPINLGDFDNTPLPDGGLEMLVGYAPVEVAASSGLLSNEILVPPAGAERVSGRIWRAMEAIEDELIDPDPSGATAAVVRRYAEVIALNMARLAFSKAAGIGLPGFETMRDPRLMRAVAAAARDPIAKWTVASLAHVAGMSRTAFSQTFRSLTGTTPMQCIAAVRLNFAAHALSQGTRNLEQLAARIGYGSSEAFIRAFQRRYGVTPGRWREHGSAKSSAPPDMPLDSSI